MQSATPLNTRPRPAKVLGSLSAVATPDVRSNGLSSLLISHLPQLTLLLRIDFLEPAAEPDVAVGAVHVCCIALHIVPHEHADVTGRDCSRQPHVTVEAEPHGSVRGGYCSTCHVVEVHMETICSECVGIDFQYILIGSLVLLQLTGYSAACVGMEHFQVVSNPPCRGHCARTSASYERVDIHSAFDVVCSSCDACQNSIRDIGLCGSEHTSHGGSVPCDKTRVRRKLDANLAATAGRSSYNGNGCRIYSVRIHCEYTAAPAYAPIETSRIRESYGALVTGDLPAPIVASGHSHSCSTPAAGMALRGMRDCNRTVCSVQCLCDVLPEGRDRNQRWAVTGTKRATQRRIQLERCRVVANTCPDAHTPACKGF